MYAEKYNKRGLKTKKIVKNEMIKFNIEPTFHPILALTKTKNAIGTYTSDKLVNKTGLAKKHLKGSFVDGSNVN